jgi:hypothetical protein
MLQELYSWLDTRRTPQTRYKETATYVVTRLRAATMKTIQVHARDGSVRGSFTVDDEDYERVSAHTWSLDDHGYIKSRKMGLLSRWLMQCDDSSKVVDHIDRCRTNNCRSNLRVVTYSVNAYNRTRDPRHTNKYLGVVPWKGKWRVRLRNICYGTYNTQEHAAMAYDHHALAHFGIHANLNGVPVDPTFVLKPVKRKERKQGEGTISFDEKYSKWRCSVYMDRKSIWLGHHETKAGAEVVLCNFLDTIKKKKQEEHAAKPITRNEDGVAVINVKSGDDVVQALVDDELWHELTKTYWHYQKGFYPRHRGVSMHEKVMAGIEREKDMVIDHINHNPLDNRKANLRFATKSQNAQNRARHKSAILPRGVSRTQYGRYTAAIMYKRETLYIGSYTTADEAALKYDEKALELFGAQAMTNARDARCNFS